MGVSHRETYLGEWRQMRTKKSLINIAISCGSYLICMVSTFIIRGMFSSIIGEEYAGVESAFLNAISMLAVVELGIGTGIVYKLYRPIADGDTRQISLLLKFYKKAYSVIAAVVFAAGLVVAVFIPNAINEDFGHSWLSFIFILYLCDTLASYLFANRRAMFVADQKNYVTTLCYTGAQLLGLVLQIIMLNTLPSLIGKAASVAVYLCVRITVRLVENISIGILFKKRYPDIDLKIKDNVSKDETSDLFTRIRALMVHKVTGLSLQATSSLIVTKLVDVVRGGFYGNYLLLSNAVNTIGTQFFNGITASFGDLYVSSGKEAAYKRFKTIFFVNYMLYSFFAVSYFVISEPFVELWIGDENAVFSALTVSLMSTYIYMYGIRQCIFVARNVTGEYTKDKWFAVGEALLNVVIGVFLVSKIGVIGIPIGNIISTLAIPFWVQSRIVYKDIFGVRVREYFICYVRYFVVFIFAGGITYAVSNLLDTESLLLNFFVRVALCAIIPNLINVIVFWRTQEFGYIRGAAAGLLGRFKGERSDK